MSLISPTDRTVPITVERRIELTPSESFQIIAPIDLGLIFHKWGPLPGVTGVKNQTGSWDQVGRSRNPQLTDGTTANEQLTEYNAPHSFAYQLTEFTNPILSRLAIGVRGEWTFTPDGPGTLIRWTYEFLPRPHRRLALRLGLAPLWRRYMESAIEATVVAARDIAHQQLRGSAVISSPIPG
ncbi:SRPBCC family protein [uncultured Microbacterium sp.]|uniref:SRPBCC family protein n=1 Tax=uncultured Microbacterium sp. TaxID=191216 RepID=UPI0035CA9172